MIALLPWVVVALLIAAALIYNERQGRRLLAAQADAAALRHWLLHNLRAIRAKTDYAFPEAVTLCNSLEMALPTRSLVDVDGLERHLCALRRKHNFRIIDGVDPQRTVARARDILAQIEAAADAQGAEGIAQHARTALEILAGRATR